MMNYHVYLNAIFFIISAYCLILQEELAFTFETLNQLEDALVQYDELDALYSQFIINSQAGGKNILHLCFAIDIDVLVQAHPMGAYKYNQAYTYNICDMIKGNESLVENFNFYFLTPLSHNFKMLHFDANANNIGYLVRGLKNLLMLKTIQNQII